MNNQFFFQQIKYALLVATLLTACSTINDKPSLSHESPSSPYQAKPTNEKTITPLRPASVSLETLLKYIQTFTSLSVDNQKNEFLRVTATKNNELARWQLILISAYPGSRFRDRAHAQSLLEEYFKNGDSKDESLMGFAALLKKQLQEYQRLEETIIADSEKIKDEQKRTQLLQHKLEELISVQKTMNERRQALPK